MLLPRKLSVDIHRAEEGGFWAKVRELPGCNTQGEDFIDLVDMINDAIFTYFDVPQKMRNALGHYVPEIPEELRKRIEARARHSKIEEAMTRIIKERKTLAFSNIGLS
ncbi:MAG: type II toxin-antitoxin system HicB family antitoxin [Candidatus Sungbacteria bacterium]|nr:type II toxin-antitoxin system HicB family antitoxin [Candidatus Sungbacteria bacterium]